MGDPLPQLLDAKAIQREMGITRAAAERVMRHVPIVQVPGLRKVYCRREDVARKLDAWTFEKDEIPA